MTINRRAALFFAICNILLVVYLIFLHFYMGETIYGRFDHKHGHEISAGSFFSYADALLVYVVLVGMIWVLTIFREKLWIRLSVILFLSWQIILEIILFLLGFLYPKAVLFHLLTPILYINFVLITYMLVAFILVKSKAIKKYLLCYILLYILSALLPTIGAKLYGGLGGHNWVLINRSFLAKLPFIASLILFIEVYNMAGIKVVTSSS